MKVKVTVTYVFEPNFENYPNGNQTTLQDIEEADSDYFKYEASQDQDCSIDFEEI